MDDKQLGLYDKSFQIIMVAQKPRNLSDEHKRLLYACAWRLLRSVKFGDMSVNILPDDLVNQAWLRTVRYQSDEWINPKHITKAMVQYILSDFTGRSLSAYENAHRRPVSKSRMVTPNSAQAYIVSNNRAMFCEVKLNNLVEDMICEMVAVLPTDQKSLFEQVYGYAKPVDLVSSETGIKRDSIYRRLKKSKKIIERELGFVIR